MLRKKIKDETAEAASQVAQSNSKRLTTFAFKKSENGIDIKIIGCLQVKSAPSQPFYSKGIVLLSGKVFSVFDLQALAGLKPKEITDESCIVLLDPDESFTNFSRAILVDDVSEMLKIAEQNMAGLPVDTLWGRHQQAQSENITPDFPDIDEHSSVELQSEFQEDQKLIDLHLALDKILS